jgi:threonine aldolase
LAEDHARAENLAKHVSNLPYVEALKPADTNMVLFRLKAGFDPRDLLAHLDAHGIRLMAMDPFWLRAVLHYDVGDQEVSRLKEALSTWKA